MNSEYGPLRRAPTRMLPRHFNIYLSRRISDLIPPNEVWHYEAARAPQRLGASDFLHNFTVFDAAYKGSELGLAVGPRLGKN